MAKTRGRVVGRLVRRWDVYGVGTVRIGYDPDWKEYRVQSWYADGTPQGDYPTDYKVDAIETAHHQLALLEDLAGPTIEQCAAVLDFADRHGREWREALAQAWYTGRDASQPFGHLLRQVRNSFGPAWLEHVTLSALRVRAESLAKGADPEA